LVEEHGNSSIEFKKSFPAISARSSIRNESELHTSPTSFEQWQWVNVKSNSIPSESVLNQQKRNHLVNHKHLKCAVNVKSSKDKQFNEKGEKNCKKDTVKKSISILKKVKIYSNIPQTPESDSLTAPEMVENETLDKLTNKPHKSSTPTQNSGKQTEGSENSNSSIDPYGSDRSSGKFLTNDEPNQQHPCFWLKSPGRPDVLSNPGTPDSSVVRSSPAGTSKSSPIISISRAQVKIEDTERNEELTNTQTLNRSAETFVPRSFSNLDNRQEVAYGHHQQQQLYSPKSFVCAYQQLATRDPQLSCTAPIATYIPTGQQTYYQVSRSPVQMGTAVVHGKVVHFNDNTINLGHKLTPRAELRQKIMRQVFDRKGN